VKCPSLTVNGIFDGVRYDVASFSQTRCIGGEMVHINVVLVLSEVCCRYPLMQSSLIVCVLMLFGTWSIVQFVTAYRGLNFY